MRMSVCDAVHLPLLFPWILHFLPNVISNEKIRKTEALHASWKLLNLCWMTKVGTWGALRRDLGDRVKVFCAGAGTNIGQILGKTGSFWDSWPLIQDWRTKVHYLLSDITAKVLLTHSRRTNTNTPEDNDLWTPWVERWEKQEVVKVTGRPFARLPATGSGQVIVHKRYTHVEEWEAQM